MNNLPTKSGFVILSRYSSQRLPGKALQLIGDVPLLGRIITKIRLAFPQTPVVVATSIEPSDNPIQELAEKFGAHCYRGSLPNVALRFLEASEKFNFQYAIRITGDSLYIDPAIVKRVMSDANESDFTLASNRKFKMYPVGQTVEIVQAEKFKKYYSEFKTDDDFEHVTDFFYRHESLLKEKIIHHQNPDGVFRELSMAIDTPDDFKMAQKIFDRLGQEEFGKASYQKVYHLMKEMS